MARTGWWRRGIFAAALLLAAPHAFACSISPRAMSRTQVESYARAQFAAAVAVVDAEVETPMEFGPALKPGLMPLAILRVIRRYKGVADPVYDRISLVYFSSCDIALIRKGERVRILLTDGSELFRADMTANGPPSEREEGLAEFNAEIDRLAGTPRPAGFSTYPGELDPSSMETVTTKNATAGPAALPARPAPPPRGVWTQPALYIAGALGLLLAFLAGLLIGRRGGRAAA